MRLTLFVTLTHILLLFLFHLRRDTPAKIPTSKILVRMVEENVQIKEGKSPKQKPTSALELEPIASLSETEIIEPLALDPLPTIEPLHHEAVSIKEIQPPKPKTEIKPSPTSEKTKIVAKEPTKQKFADKPKPKVVAKPSPSKSVTKPIAKTPETKKTSTSLKKPDEKLLSLMKDSLTKMDKIPKTIQAAPKKGGNTANTSTTPKIAKLKSESLDMTPTELSYAEELAMYLKRHLHFPDEGSMKLKLVLTDSGKVESFSIISSSSARNKEIGQKAIAACVFPSFKSRFPNEKSKTFTLQLNIE